MVALGWILVALGLAFIIVGFVAGAKKLLSKQATEMNAAGVQNVAVPGFVEVIKALVKTPEGVFVAVGLVLLLVGLQLLGQKITT